MLFSSLSSSYKQSAGLQLHPDPKKVSPRRGVFFFFWSCFGSNWWREMLSLFQYQQTCFHLTSIKRSKLLAVCLSVIMPSFAPFITSLRVYTDCSIQVTSHRARQLARDKSFLTEIELLPDLYFLVLSLSSPKPSFSEENTLLSK